MGVLAVEGCTLQFSSPTWVISTPPSGLQVLRSQFTTSITPYFTDCKVVNESINVGVLLVGPVSIVFNLSVIINATSPAGTFVSNTPVLCNINPTNAVIQVDGLSPLEVGDTGTGTVTGVLTPSTGAVVPAFVLPLQVVIVDPGQTFVTSQ